MADTLAPCPFCASTNLSIYGVEIGGRYHAVLCRECWAMGPEATTAQEATERWNRRRQGRAPASRAPP
jgi:Lar family restriction alleviation protein